MSSKKAEGQKLAQQGTWSTQPQTADFNSATKKIITASNEPSAFKILEGEQRLIPIVKEENNSTLLQAFNLLHPITSGTYPYRAETHVPVQQKLQDTWILSRHGSPTDSSAPLLRIF